MKKSMQCFSENLKYLMGEITISELSREVDIPQPTLSRYLAGQRQITLDNLVKIANYFNIEIDVLVGRKDF